jgi:hypothetical protein
VQLFRLGPPHRLFLIVQLLRLRPPCDLLPYWPRRNRAKSFIVYGNQWIYLLWLYNIDPTHFRVGGFIIYGYQWIYLLWLYNIDPMHSRVGGFIIYGY